MCTKAFDRILIFSMHQLHQPYTHIHTHRVCYFSQRYRILSSSFDYIHFTILAITQPRRKNLQFIILINFPSPRSLKNQNNTRSRARRRLLLLLLSSKADPRSQPPLLLHTHTRTSFNTPERGTRAAKRVLSPLSSFSL